MRLILPISFLIIAGMLFFLVIDPFYMEVKQSKLEIATYSTAVNDSEDLQKTRDSLVGKYKNIKNEDKERLEQFLPHTINNIELILEIEKIANSYNMPVKDIKFESKSLTGNSQGTAVVAENDPSKYLPYGIFPMEFTVEGKYENFLSFLNGLEHNLRLIDVKSISFSVSGGASSGENKTSPDIYTYNLKIQAYWIK